MIRVLGLALYGPQAASHRVRLSQYAPGLAKVGIELHLHSLLDDTYLQSRFDGGPVPLASVVSSVWTRLRLLRSKHRFDAAIVHCELFSLFPGWIEHACLCMPYIYDFDDAFFLRYRKGRLKMLRPFLGSKFDVIIRRASAVTAGNRWLNQYAALLNPSTYLLPSVVDTDVYLPASDRDRVQPFTIGWVGSSSTAIYLNQVVAPLLVLAAEGAVRLIVVGGKAPSIPGVEVIELSWQADKEIELIKGFDVGIMPLPSDEWAHGKCAFKLVQYMACGIPVLASRVGANVDVVSKECGFLADSDTAWTAALRVLRDQPELRRQMGIAARERAVADYSLERNLPIMAEIIRKVATNG